MGSFGIHSKDRSPKAHIVFVQSIARKRFLRVPRHPIAQLNRTVLPPDLVCFGMGHESRTAPCPATPTDFPTRERAQDNEDFGRHSMSCLPAHGRINCVRCFPPSETVFDRTRLEAPDESWRITANPLAWGHSEPEIVVLGLPIRRVPNQMRAAAVRAVQLGT